MNQNRLRVQLFYYKYEWRISYLLLVLSDPPSKLLVTGIRRMKTKSYSIPTPNYLI